MLAWALATGQAEAMMPVWRWMDVSIESQQPWSMMYLAISKPSPGAPCCLVDPRAPWDSWDAWDAWCGGSRR